MNMKNLIKKGAELIRRSKNILVFSGAGLSTESGIPDFRSPGGLWEKYNPSDFIYQRLLTDEKAREKYWRMSTEFYDMMNNAQPNRAYLAINELENMGKLLAIVTQNVDHLHHKAGNSPDKIIEIHGTAFSVSCQNCGRKYDRAEIERHLKAEFKVPYCNDCSGFLKPDTISFGQSMPADKMSLSFKYAAESDLCIVLGSSLVVYPAAAVPERAVESGAKLMIINRDITHLDRSADLAIHDSLSKALESIMEVCGRG